MILLVLGFIVVENENSVPKHSRVLVSNNLSIFDHIALHLGTGTFTVCIVILLTIIVIFVLSNIDC